MILTERDRMILTPTYHVFEMFMVHQNSTLLPAELDSYLYSLNGETVPQVSVSSSVDENGKIHVSLCNTNPHEDAEIECSLEEMKASAMSGRILSAGSM